ncbi:MAG: TonB-dependent receptor [Pseudohongiella sp.]|nr:TonB-dependent receptor [Pseudohongiella sp.]
MTTNTKLNTFRLSEVALAVALALSAGTAAAAEPPAHVEEIIIEGQRHTSGGHLQSINDADVRKLSAATSDTASLLSQLAGVSVNQTGAVSSLPMIRGLSDDRLRIKVDGMDMIAACPNHMNPPLSYMAPSDVGQMTVFAGITPVSVGGDSIGGTVISESRAPEFSDVATFEGEAGGFSRSNNSATGMNVRLSRTSENLFTSYSGSYSQGDNYTAAKNFKTIAQTGRPGHTLPLDEVASSAYETQNHNLRVAYKTGADTFDVQLGYQNMPSQLYPNQRMDLLDNQQARVNLNWQRETGWGQIQSRFYHEQVEHGMDFGPDRQFWYGSKAVAGAACSPMAFHGDPAGTCASGMPMFSDSKNSGLSLTAEIDLPARGLVRVGAELQQFRLEDYWTASGGAMGPGTFENINNGQRDRTAVFAEHELNLADDWLVMYGARVERVMRDADDVHGYSTAMNAMGMQAMEANAFNQANRKNTDTNVDLTLLTRYELSSQIDLELGVAQKVRSANLYETYPWSSWTMAASMNNLVGDGNGYVGNLALNPEKAHTLSGSLNWRSADTRHEFSVNPYITRVDDYIDAVAMNATWRPGQYNVLKYQNQQAELKGVDLTLASQLANNASGDWKLAGNLSFINARNTDTGAGLYNIVPMQARLALSQELGGWDNSLEWVFAGKKDDLSSVRNELPTDSYSLLNLRLSHSWESVRLDLGIENLLNEFYFLPAGGTYVAQGMTMSMNGIPFGIGVPGMGRSIYAGVNYRF